jgi:hypothetical protein
VSARREAGERFSLSRWSRRKLGAAPGAPAPTTPAPAAAAPTAPATPAKIELPPVASLDFDSDFTAFLRPEVDDKIKRAALKQLFRDPRFNVMDGLDTYIDDYTKADPIPPDMLADLLQRFGGAPDAGATPASAATAARDGPEATSESLTGAPAGEELAAPPAQASISAASGGEDADAERTAGDTVVPSPAGGAENEQATRSPGDEQAPRERGGPRADKR